MQADSRTLHEYLIALKYRGKLILGVAGTVFGAAVLLAVFLPPVYQATATILIEQQEIPTEMVRSTITSYADQRVQTISRRVMTTANLRPVILKYNLYPVAVAEGAVEAAADIMRDSDVKLELVSAEVTDPKSGKPVQATIAFKISYEAAVPGIAQQVTNDVAQIYLAENIKTRTEQTAEISGFLGAEADRLKKDVAELETQLAQFKEKNVGKLPELATLNIQTLDRIDVELRDTDRQLRTVEAQRIALQSQAAQLETSDAPLVGGKVVTPGQRLLEAQTQYYALAAKYSPDHPDVVRARKELESLRSASGGGGGDRARIEEQLMAKRAELAIARDRYAPEHPDVRRLSGEAAGLEAQLAATPRSSPAGSDYGREALRASAAYIQVQAGLSTADADLRSLRAKQFELMSKRNEYEARLAQSPEVERVYRELSRDYDAAVIKLKDVQAKQLSAQLAESLETSQKGERFELLEPASLPEAPVRPNRPAIVFLGLMFALASGIGAMVMVEALDDTVRGSRGVAALLNAPPLAVIPIIEIGRPGSGSRTASLAAAAVLGAWLAALLARGASLPGLN